MTLPTQGTTSVGVVGGDPVVGRALEQLLRSAGYYARFLPEASFDSSRTLDGLDLLLFVGGLDARRREASMAIVKVASTEANLPLLELASSLEISEDGAADVLPWPCRVDELRERIEAVLEGGSHPHGREASDG